MKNNKYLQLLIVCLTCGWMSGCFSVDISAAEENTLAILSNTIATEQLKTSFLINDRSYDREVNDERRLVQNLQIFFRITTEEIDNYNSDNFLTPTSWELLIAETINASDEEAADEEPDEEPSSLEPELEPLKYVLLSEGEDVIFQIGDFSIRPRFEGRFKEVPELLTAGSRTVDTYFTVLLDSITYPEIFARLDQAEPIKVIYTRASGERLEYAMKYQYRDSLTVTDTITKNFSPVSDDISITFGEPESAKLIIGQPGIAGEKKISPEYFMILRSRYPVDSGIASADIDFDFNLFDPSSWGNSSRYDSITAKSRDTEEAECFSRNYFFDELASPFFISAGLLNYQCDEAIKTYLEYEAIGGEMVEDTFPDMHYSYYRFLKTYEISR